jgi:hypothetical protein
MQAGRTLSELSPFENVKSGTEISEGEGDDFRCKKATFSLPSLITRRDLAPLKGVLPVI